MEFGWFFVTNNHADIRLCGGNRFVNRFFISNNSNNIQVRISLSMACGENHGGLGLLTTDSSSVIIATTTCRYQLLHSCVEESWSPMAVHIASCQRITDTVLLSSKKIPQTLPTLLPLCNASLTVWLSLPSSFWYDAFLFHAYYSRMRWTFSILRALYGPTADFNEVTCCSTLFLVQLHHRGMDVFRKLNLDTWCFVTMVRDYLSTLWCCSSILS